MKSFWMSAKTLVVAALLQLLGTAMSAAEDVCEDFNKDYCSCQNYSEVFNPALWCSQPKYYTPPTFPKFVAQPTSIIRDPKSQDPITLVCQISNAANFSITWEHNGVPINNSDMYDGFNNSDTLTIKRPLDESEGSYRCRVDYQHGNFSLVSREAHFETPRFYGWMDSASGNVTTTASDTTIVVAAQEGGSFVLECNPRTNDPSISTVAAVWTKNYVHVESGSSEDNDVIFLDGRNTSMLVRNFHFSPGGGNVTFQCLLSGFRYLKELKRKFILIPARGQTPQPDFLVPQNRTVLAGATVNLYCLSKSESSIGSDNTWLFENRTINLSARHSNHYDIVDRGEVLIIRNISVETSGAYTCRTVNGEEYSAYVDVLDTITMESSTHNISGDNQITIDTEAAATTHTITLSCLAAGSQLDDGDNLNIDWFFRGRPIHTYSSYSTSLGSQRHRAAVTFIKWENLLTMTSEDPWELIGTMQCMVSIASLTTGADQLDQAKSAIVHILARGKPDPPTFINITRAKDDIMPWYFVRQVTYDSAYSSTEGDGTYIIEVFVQTDSSQLCTCHRRYNYKYMNFDYSQWLHNEHHMFVRVAFEVNGVRSDFLPYVDSCSLPMELDKNPPAPTFTANPTFDLSSENQYEWDVTQKWSLTDECHYPSKYYNKYVTLSCPRHSKTDQAFTEVYTYKASCRTICNLTVTAQGPNGLYRNSNMTAITTPSIAPMEPPTPYNVQRVNDTTFAVNITVLNEAISCMDEPPYLVVNYSISGSNSSSISTIDLGNCSSTESSSHDISTVSYVCQVTDMDSCWNDYDIRVAYRSIIDGHPHYSNHSRVLPLLNQMPSEEPILAGVRSMNVMANSSKEIKVNFNISDNITCIVRKEGLISAQVCYTLQTEKSCESMEFNHLNCQNQSINKSVTIQHLDSNSTYCIRANIILYGNTSHMRTLYTLATTAEERAGPTTSGPSSDSHVTTSRSEPLNQGVSQTVMEAIVGVAAVAILCVVVACIFMMTCCYYRSRKKRNYQRLNDRDNESIISRDLVTVTPAERAESVHSERTDPEFMVHWLLKDIKEQPDGEEDHLNISEDFTHPEEGEFEEVERESLQGLAEDLVLIETESSGTPDSLKDRRRLLLNNIQKQNKAYQASRQQGEAVELSPINPPQAAIPSMISTPAPSSTRVPLPNIQRVEPDGDQGISVQSEGFHNPATYTPSLLGRLPLTTCTPTNQIPAHDVITGHMTFKNGPHLQHNQQQLSQSPLPSANHGHRTMGTASSMTTPSPRDSSQTTTTFNDRRTALGAASSNGGYIQSPIFGEQIPRTQPIQQQPFGDDSFSLIELPSGGESNTLNLNSQPSLGGHVLMADGYVQDTAATIGGGCREERVASAESGNEDDSLSNEGDSNSVFDDDIVHREIAHSIRPRSTVTSGFQSGSSECASPEPPKKSTSSVSSLLSSVSTIVPPSSLNVPCTPSTRNALLHTSAPPSSNLSSDLLTPHTSHSHSPSISPTPVTEFTFNTYRPSSTGSSGYVTNGSSQSYHSSSATSQTSQTSAPASSELEQDLEGGESSLVPKYTVPSLLTCTSSPATSHAAAVSFTAASNNSWTANNTPVTLQKSMNTRYLCNSHHPVELQDTNVPVTDYVNTGDVDLSKISTDLGELSQASERFRVTTGHQDVSFVFPVS